MINYRKAQDRGVTELGWLSSRHTFSFDTYYDPGHMNFRTLRVINEDTVAPGQGFPTHPHRDMEIVTYVVSGQLEHKDSMGNGSIIRSGEIQRMTTGSGVTHSEYNPSHEHPVHFLQIWILPDEKGLSPGYEQKDYRHMMKEDDLTLIASRDGRLGSVTINQDVDLYTCRLAVGKDIDVAIAIAQGRGLWIQLIKGELIVAEGKLLSGDACSVTGEKAVRLQAEGESLFLLFDLA